MNFRNKYFRTTIRVLLGLMFIFSGISGLLAGKSMQGVPPEMVQNTTALWNTGIFQMIKVTEIIAGLMLTAGFLPWLGAIFVAPICIGIIVVNGLTAPAFLPAGIIVTVLNAYLGYAYWPKYKALFDRRAP